MQGVVRGLLIVGVVVLLVSCQHITSERSADKVVHEIVELYNYDNVDEQIANLDQLEKLTNGKLQRSIKLESSYLKELRTIYDQFEILCKQTKDLGKDFCADGLKLKTSSNIAVNSIQKINQTTQTAAYNLDYQNTILLNDLFTSESETVTLNSTVLLVKEQEDWRFVDYSINGTWISSMIDLEEVESAYQNRIEAANVFRFQLESAVAILNK